MFKFFFPKTANSAGFAEIPTFFINCERKRPALVSRSSSLSLLGVRLFCRTTGKVRFRFLRQRG